MVLQVCPRYMVSLPLRSVVTLAKWAQLALTPVYDFFLGALCPNCGVATC